MAPQQPQHNMSSKRLVSLISTMSTIIDAVLSIYHKHLPISSILIVFSLVRWEGLFRSAKLKMCTCVQHILTFFRVCVFLFVRLWTASQPCCLVFKVDCEWQRLLEASSTYPKKRYPTRKKGVFDIDMMPCIVICMKTEFFA